MNDVSDSVRILAGDSAGPCVLLDGAAADQWHSGNGAAENSSDAVGSNENKMSDGHRERAWLEVKAI
jgi:hypothetical protein